MATNSCDDIVYREPIDIDETRELYITDEGHLWTNDIIGDEVMLATDQRDLTALIAQLARMMPRLRP